MPTPAVLLLNFVLALLPQANGGRIDAFLQAVPGITDSLDQIADGVARGPLLQRTKATLLEGYGMVLTLELRLDAPQPLRQQDACRERTPADRRAASDLEG